MTTEKSIRLHKEFGVNPTIPLCFWCGKERNEVAMLGAAYAKQAPTHMVIDYIPCDACAALQAQGITVAEARRNLGSASTLTGRWMVLTEQGIRHFVQSEAMLKAVLRARRTLVEPEAFALLLAARERSEGDAEAS
jgi:2-hydroxychromene-2-carboxylate isomerase